MVKERIIPRIRRWWRIKPFTKIKRSKKLYDRKKAKQQFNKYLKEEK